MKTAKSFLLVTLLFSVSSPSVLAASSIDFYAGGHDGIFDHSRMADKEQSLKTYNQVQAELKGLKKSSKKLTDGQKTFLLRAAMWKSIYYIFSKQRSLFRKEIELIRTIMSPQEFKAMSQYDYYWRGSFLHKLAEYGYLKEANSLIDTFFGKNVSYVTSDEGRAWVYFFLATIASLNGSEKQLFSHSKKSLSHFGKTKKTSAIRYLNLIVGMALLEKKDFTRAGQFFEKSKKQFIQSEGNSILADLLIARSLYMQKKPKEALGLLQKISSSVGKATTKKETKVKFNHFSMLLNLINGNCGEAYKNRENVIKYSKGFSHVTPYFEYLELSKRSVSRAGGKYTAKKLNKSELDSLTKNLNSKVSTYQDYFNASDFKCN